MNELEKFYPETKKAWRAWLQENHISKSSVWLVFYKKHAAQKCITWSEAVDEALCFGWIDSKKRPVDADTYEQFFSKRKANSTWSKVNKDKIEVLTAANLITPAGLASIELAKKNGSWTILDTVEALIIPDDLDKVFAEYEGAKDYFLSLSKSGRKILLSWVVLAKRAETRQNRINEIAEFAAQNLKPKQFR